MALPALPPEILAEDNPKWVTIFAHPYGRDFDELGDIEVYNMMHWNEDVAHATFRLRAIGEVEKGDQPFTMEIALGAILSLIATCGKADTGNKPCLNHQQHERLLSAIYYGLSNATLDMSGRIPLHHLREGMNSAVILADALHSGETETETDRQKDAASRVKMLIHFARICQHEDDIEKRQRQRKGAVIARLLPASEEVSG